ncbi:DUF4167 domain-containing protein [Algirhabdus cladophorae]|uniref:DUF4167 domain-containing protein n=1 Tax=Algirhabdus cladophorae TaxID=3377108 RepID=UPI003B84A85C
MRSSKSRSRSKSRNNNNNRPSGNIVNRVFDSSGPEGKVRGTPQQIIDKYNQLTRDAQLSGDRVAAENFQQHAEHYTRMLSEAQREIDARREEQERQNRERQAERDRERNERQERESNAPAPVPADPASSDQPDVVEAAAPAADGGLVETPEAAPKPKRTYKPRKPKPTEVAAETPPSDAAE